MDLEQLFLFTEVSVVFLLLFEVGLHLATIALALVWAIACHPLAPTRGRFFKVRGACGLVSAGGLICFGARPVACRGESR